MGRKQTKGQTKKLHTTQNAMLRKFLGVRLRDKTCLEDIFTRTKTTNTGGVVRQASEIQVCETRVKGLQP